MASPELSIIVVFYDMVREAQRTLLSLSRKYQLDLQDVDYEVIAIDNGSTKPLNADLVAQFGDNFRYHFFETASVSPAQAMNFGAEHALGNQLGLIVDGARLASPGLISTSLQAARAAPGAIIGSLAWHLGPKIQSEAMADGYDAAREDQMLDSIDWSNNGYRLFEKATIAPSSNIGILGGVPSECSWLMMPRRIFLDIGGFDVRFKCPGGGLMNHELMERVISLFSGNIFMLVGEGTFHQIHSGVTTNVCPGQHPMREFMEEYRSLFGADYRYDGCPVSPVYFGRLPASARRFTANRGSGDS